MARHDTDGLWSLARGTLPESETPRLRAHLRDCPSCAGLLRQMQASAALLTEPTPPRLPDEVWNRVDRQVLASAQRELGSARAGAGTRWLGWVVVGGALAAASLLFVVRGRHGVEPRRPTVAEQPAAPVPGAQAPPAPPVVASRIPARARVRLASGSERALAEGDQVVTQAKEKALVEFPKARALIMPASSLMLAEMTGTRSRLVLARGMVAVAADPGERGELIVTAGGADVIVTGTRFLVSYSDDVLHIAVTEGVVRVRTSSQEQRLVAGRGLTLRNDQWTLRSVTRTEHGILLQMDPVGGKFRRRATEPAAERPPEPAVPAEVDPAREQRPAATAPPPPAPQTPPAPEKPAPPAREDQPAWRMPGVGEIPKAVTGHLPDSLQPKASQTPNDDEYLVRKLEQLVRAGQCPAARERADAWLRAHPAPAGDDASQKNVRQAVQAVRDKCR